MPIYLYSMPWSPPCRAVLLLAENLGVEITTRLIDTRSKDHLKPDFVKGNPQHCVPTLDDDGFILWESRAIMGYLVDQYGKDDSLYPKDPKKRALVNQRLYFDIGTLFPRLKQYFVSQTFSPPCRAVALVARTLGLELNDKIVDLFKKEHLEPEFGKINPQRLVPVLDDNGFVLSESRAIMGYLVDQYGKDDSLYPKDPKKRALVDQRLYFDIGTIYQRYVDYLRPVLIFGEPEDVEKLKKIEEALAILEVFLEGKQWVTGGNITIADYTLAVTVSGIELNLKKTVLTNGDHLKPEFLKLNPQHCIPTLDDNGFALWESRAILAYLQSQYGKDESLYPKDPKKRAVVDQRLYFDMGTLYARIGEYYYPIIFQKAQGDPEKFKKLEEAFEFLEKFLTGSAWVAGDKITIADFAVISSVSTAEVVGFHVNTYPNVAKYLAKARKELAGYEDINYAGCLEFKKLMEN
uniref:Glutathione S-transferase n=1 Tax=Timema genevievae TaxID=629358 RepID=A0A7R9JSI8_TIMGE|nr:unnamed protein product [Timema genevievae]